MTFKNCINFVVKFSDYMSYDPLTICPLGKNILLK